MRKRKSGGAPADGTGRNTSVRRGAWRLWAAAAAAGGGLAGPAAQAANKTWDSGGGDANWTTAANWDADAAPVANDVLFFGTGTRLTPNNNFAANTQFNGITFNTGAAAFTLTGNAINLAGDVNDLSTNLQRINHGLNLTATRTMNVVAGGNLQVGGVIGQTAAAGLTKNGAGTLTLNGTAANTYAGTTSVAFGTLGLDFSNFAAGTNLVNPASALSLGGGGATLAVVGNAGPAVTTSQTFASTALVAGQSFVTLNSNGGAAANLALGAVTRAAGATLDVTLPAAGAVSTTTAAAGNGLFAAYATVGGANFAAKAGDNLVAYAYSADESSAAAFDTATNNVDVTAANAAPAADRTVNSLRFAAPATTLTLSGTNVVSSGGILVAPAAGASGIAGGTLQRAAGAGELIVHQFNAANPFTIGSAVADNGGAAALTKAGPGTLVLTGANTYTGATTIGQGRLVAATVADAGSSSIGLGSGAAGGVVLKGGTFEYSGAGPGTTARTFTAATAANVAGSTVDVSQATGVLTLAGSFNSNNTVVVTKTGPGTLVLGANNNDPTAEVDNSSLILSVQAGTVLLNKGTGLAGATQNTFRAVAGITDIAAGATVRLTGAGTDQIFAGAATNLLGQINMSGGTFDLNGRAESFDRFSGTGTVTNTAAGVAGALTVGQANSGSTFAGTIRDGDGPTAFTKAGTGTQILTGTNAYTGTTTVAMGILRANDGVGLPTASNLTINGGTGGAFETGANFTRPLGTGAGQVRVPGGTSGFSANGAAVTVTLGTAGSTLQWGGADFNPSALILNASTANNTLAFQHSLDFNGATRTINVNANTATVTGTVGTSAGANVGLTKGGGGTLVLAAAANPYDGPTTVAGGVLSVAALANGGSPSGIGTSGPAASNLVLTGGGTLRYTGAANVTTDRALALNGNGGLDSSGAGVLTFANPAGVVQGNAGNRTLTLTGTNTGRNTLAAVIADYAAAQTAGAAAAAGATTVTLSSVANVAAGQRVSGPGIAANTTISSIAGNVVTLSAATTGAVAAGDTLNFAATTGLAKSGTGTAPAQWVLTAANTFTGGVAINNGVLTITNSAALGTGSKTIGITNGTAGSPQLHLDGSGGPIDLPATLAFQTSYSGTTGNGAVTNLAGDNTVRGNFTLTGGGGGTTLASNAGRLTLTGNFTPNTTNRDFRMRGDGDGVITGVIANGSTVNMPVFRDGGTGTWTLAGANTYTGPTAVTAGRLLVNGSITSATTVSGSGTVGGTGTITGSLTVNPGGTVAPGASTGTLTVTGPVTFGAGTGTAPAYAAELQPSNAAARSDVLALTGAAAAGLLTLTNVDTLNLLPLEPIGQTAQTFTIATFAQLAGMFNAVQVGGAAAQGTDPLAPNYVTVAYNAADIQVTVANVSAVPEPAAAGLLGAAAAAGLLARRRRTGRGVPA